LKKHHYFKKFLQAVTILLLLTYSISIQARQSDFETLFTKFLKYYNSGDFLNSEKALSSIIKSDSCLTDNQRVGLYNALGVVSSSLGNFNKALEYSFKAESYITDRDKNSQNLAAIYNNRGHILNIKKTFDIAIEYFEKSIRIYRNLGTQDINILSSLSDTYVNISIAYIETKKYALALYYLEKSVQLNSKYKFSGLPFSYLNIAKTYVKTGNSKKAIEFYIKSINSFIDEYNKDYYRLVDVYFDYGLFLRSQGKNLQAHDFFKKALAICLKNYGEKHTIVSLSYKHLGDNYIIAHKYDSALYYYQKSLIAVNRSFNNHDIFSNPSIDSSLFDLRLLDNLKSKAQALDLFAGSQNDPVFKLKILNKSLETMDLALALIDRIRNNYVSEESRIYLAENEKETYLFATHLAYSLYSSTRDTSMAGKVYGIAQKAKAAILRNEITGNELLYSRGIPDSLREKQKSLSLNISAYNNLVLEESRKAKPDGNRISLWKDALFDMNREKEKVSAKVEKIIPQYQDLMRKTEPYSLLQIQKQMKNGETIVDYLLSNQYVEGKRKLYVFLISATNLNFRELTLDSVFAKDAEIIRKTADPSMHNTTPVVNFVNHSNALNNMYLRLIKPVESLIMGNKLFIIPDEEIGWLPFDAFLKNKPPAGQRDYDGLHFLIQDYIFSYGYSSSLIFSKNSLNLKGAKVYAFSPDYSGSGSSGHGFSSLTGAGTEIGSIFRWFKGKSFRGEGATKGNFMALLNEPAIFHLAMHSLPDSNNSKYSYLMFDSHNPRDKDASLYNYEISLARIKSPMVVLSACNSGTGTLYYGEGLMSLARSFTLAGASSVIRTSWEINDESSVSVISRFYYYLSKGKEKNEAMRLAKLEYLKKASPSYTDPYFWAAYEVLGDNAPVAHDRTGSYVLFSLLGIITTAGLLFYFRRRRIFSDRSL
jgi:CHAT domain-containing protein